LELNGSLLLFRLIETLENDVEASVHGVFCLVYEGWEGEGEGEFINCNSYYFEALKLSFSIK